MAAIAPATPATGPAARRCAAGAGQTPVNRGVIALRYGTAAAARAVLTCRHASASTAGPTSAALTEPRPSAPEPSWTLATAAHNPLAPALRSLLLSAASSLPCTLLTAAASSASEVAATATAAAAPAAVAMTFEPRAPDAGVLAAQALVLLLTAGAGAYWWYVVVPSERAAVGRSKRLGALNSYLGELEAPQAVQERKLERWFYTDWLLQREKRRQRLGQKPAGAPVASTSAATTNALAASAAQTAASTPGAPDASPNPNAEDPYVRQDVPYNDDLLRPTVDTPTPRFLSLDNPLVATAALLTAVGLLSSLLHGP